jgi:PST family polysaccharide transporter
MLYPLETINGIVNPTLHPLLSALQHDRPRMARTYLRIATLVGSIALPAMAVMGALAPEIVRTIWGAQWGRSIDVFAILCIVGSVQPIGATFGSVFLATNRTRLLALMGLINACVMMAGMAAGVRWGIEGVAIGYSCAYGLIFFPTMYVVVVVLLGARLREMLAVLVPPLAIATPTLAALIGFNSLMRGRWGDVPHLLAGVLSGIAIWATLFFLLERRLLGELVAQLPGPVRTRLERWGLPRADSGS